MSPSYSAFDFIDHTFKFVKNWLVSLLETNISFNTSLKFKYVLSINTKIVLASEAYTYYTYNIFLKKSPENFQNKFNVPSLKNSLPDRSYSQSLQALSY